MHVQSSMLQDLHTCTHVQTYGRAKDHSSSSWEIDQWWLAPELTLIVKQRHRPFLSSSPHVHKHIYPARSSAVTWLHHVVTKFLDHWGRETVTLCLRKWPHVSGSGRVRDDVFKSRVVSIVPVYGLDVAAGRSLMYGAGRRLAPHVSGWMLL
jgi:hypothetical protein